MMQLLLAVCALLSVDMRAYLMLLQKKRSEEKAMVRRYANRLCRQRKVLVQARHIYKCFKQTIQR